MRVYKAGIVGYGYMGEIRQRVIDENPRLTLAGIFESNLAVRQKIICCPVFDSFGALLQQDLDIVFVCTPNCYSPAICVEGLQAGKHVFCEKPPGRNIADIQKIRRAEQTSTAKLMFGFNHRFHPGILKAKVIIDNERLGKILSLRGVYGKSGGVRFPHSWRNNKDISGGGILLDQGIHMLDLFQYFCGPFDEVKCFANDTFWKFDVEDNAYVMLRNAKRQMAFLHSSAVLWKHTFRLDIVLEKGYLNIEGLLSKSGSYGRERLTIGKRQFEDESFAVGNPSEEVIYFDRDLSWALEVNEFIQCIDENKPVTCSSSQDALSIMSVVAKAYADAGLSLVKETVV